ncbi:tyrosine decarboxylase [candidate division KSB1 bacterium]|nr:tyrosine decarboxylase [candidate division KSB1 bacterium]
MDDINVDALFLGPKSENRSFFKEMLNFLMDDYMEWRRDYHATDQPAILESDHIRDDFRATLLKTRLTLTNLAANLQLKSMPWFSSRYLGHMTTDTLMAANLAYMLTLLYNPNNCAYEGSPATTELEIEVGKQLAAMLGYDTKKSWGHITSGGTIANYEGLWLARNLKSVPLAVADIAPDLVAGLDEWQLLNFSTKKTLDLLDRVQQEGLFERFRRHSAAGKGSGHGKLGKVLVAQSKHYSWVKAVDILGIGKENLIFIPVGPDYRMDISVLEQTLTTLLQQNVPVLTVVGIVGTTEEGAVDEIHRIAELRRAFEKQGLSFYFHIDAAYGGYARALFLSPDGSFMSPEQVQQEWQSPVFEKEKCRYPPESVYQAFKSMPEADSITIDPHKMGYVPYATGAIVAKDKRILSLISYFAAYVFEEKEENPVLLGSYIMEGSKAGATVAAAWTAHQITPLHARGYGRIIRRGIEAAIQFYHAMTDSKQLQINGKAFKAIPLIRPDLNILDFAFNRVGNSDLTKMNLLNQKIYEKCSYKSGPVYTNDFLTSKTALDSVDYGHVPGRFALAHGIPEQEWDRIRTVYILRMCIMTPFLTNHTPFDTFLGKFLQTMKEKISQIMNENEAFI